MGKLLLKELLQQFQLSDRIGLSNIQYTQYNRPFFDSEFEFSTSHSGEISVCAGTINAKVGIDLEQIRQVNVKDYKELFTDREWKMIKESKDINRSFYTLWTRKEACLKAIGTGVAVSFASIDVCSDIVTHEGYEYYLHELKIKEGYIAYLASNINPLKITIQMFNT
ncbi:MAG: 4'-phosphopantetheinyl transferase superfamily protein [Bacteroidota bacterium]